MCLWFSANKISGLSWKAPERIQKLFIVKVFCADIALSAILSLRKPGWTSRRPGILHGSLLLCQKVMAGGSISLLITIYTVVLGSLLRFHSLPLCNISTDSAGAHRGSFSGIRETFQVCLSIHDETVKAMRGLSEIYGLW